MTRKNLLRALGALILLFVLIQLVPYGRAHTNPPVLQEPAWDSPQTETLARAACYDCHSNEVVWPWYSSIAPFPWLAQRDVDEGRSKLNFSEMNRRQELNEVMETVVEGEMPPLQYTLIRNGGRLDAVERQALVDGLQKTLGR